jgi:SAM-dependent methyltransferase
MNPPTDAAAGPVRRPVFIARQSARPSGIVGRAIVWIMARETAELNERATTLLSLRPSDQVLEIGFGHGRTVARIATAVPQGRVAGVDVSDSMTRLAIRHNRRAVAAGRLDLRTGDAASLPLDDGQFDKALSVHTVYFWNDPRACLREVRRVLRPGARFVLGFTPSASAHAASFPAEVYTFYDENQIRAMLIAAGFESVELTRVGDAFLAVALVPSEALEGKLLVNLSTTRPGGR